MTFPKQYEVFLAALDPTTGAEIKKTRPCIIISPDEMNKRLRTVIIAPMTSNNRNYPFRTRSFFKNKEGSIALDQMRCLDKSRLFKRLGILPHEQASEISDRLVEIFS